ncbi:permease-like cell division protein FtsX [Microbacterium paludicola]|jgi:cell division transport system permease protein|uniref:Cell division protein FtsX n=1 Tax=Microbacterium paludicola TaxID=300019 RepID=A0A4Y9FZG9_9MICO|nr:permease-like cell division protein FtsX [Microbacterium paludicola]MBF0815264.1 FtsX-like permease family protein [Microbacterium paludicola]TFU34134.1 FtsX-like permease family protein [Microbacterium paludicola]
MRLGLILSEVLTGLRRNASMVVSVILVTFVSLTFVGAAILMQAQIATMRDYFQDRAQVDVYMCSSISNTETCTGGVATEEQIAAVQGELQGPTLSPLIREFSYQTPAEAYESLVENFPENATVFTEEQTSAVFHVNLLDPTRSDVIVEAFSGVEGVEQITDQLQYLDPLFSALTIATYMAVGVAGLMLISAVLLISTTIRLSAYARRREVGIMRLVGASNRFIQTPFVLEGVVAALIGSLLASGAVLLGVKFGVEGYLTERMGTIPWVGLGEALLVVPVIVLVGVVLAALSAGFAIRRWLRA